MALNFLEAIVDVGKASDAVTVAKLKSHSKVGYQNHPMGEAMCANCGMFTPAEASADNKPACSMVRPPISPHGWCEEHDRLDRSDDVRERLASMLGIKIGDELSDVAKDGPPGEARDERGRWTEGSGGGSGTKQDGQKGSVSAKPRLGMPASYRNPYRMSHGSARAYTPGDELPRARAEEQMRRAQQKVDDLERQLSENSQDKSEDIYWGIHRALQQARDDLANLKSRIPTQKVFNPDEPRDAIGRWTSGDDGPDHPDWMHGSEGTALADALGEIPSDMHDSIGKIEDAHSNLDASSQDAEDIASREDDITDEHGTDSKEYQEWEKANNAALNDVADKAMELRNAVADHLQATAGVLAQLDARIQKHANENGKRAG